MAVRLDMLPANSDSPEETPADRVAAVGALRDHVDRLADSRCGACSQRLCGHQILFSIAMGLADRPLCLPCLASSLGRQASELRDSLWQHFRHRECYATVWAAVSGREDLRGDGLPKCLWPESDEHPAASTSPERTGSDGQPLTEIAVADVEWDAGDLACGDLLLQLRQRLQGLAPGTVLGLMAYDRGAIEDLPAWCRLTGHRLLLAEHPRYRIQRKPA